ncbi:MAG: dockerin type I repeat-containing protein [Euryarchaeota archaeon]|nr:dockerin type I repeat-containing protein [Euryarchaeota archaeon]
MNKNKLRSTIVTLVVAIVLIGMMYGAVAESCNAPNLPEPKLPISTADVLLTRMNGNTGIAGLEDSGRFTDPRNGRPMPRTGIPARPGYGGLVDMDVAYKPVGAADAELVMSAAALYECQFTHSVTAGDFNGDGGTDAIVFTGSYNPSTYAYTFEHVSVVNGYTGIELWGQSIVYETWKGFDDVPAYSVGDLDSNYKDDVIVKSQSYDSVADKYTTSVYLKQGCNGSEFWNRSVTGDGGYSAGTWTYIHDLDGDYRDDVIIISESYNSTTTKHTANIYAIGYGGQEFWNRSVTGDGEYGAYMWVESYCALDDNATEDDVIFIAGSYNSVVEEHTARAHVVQGCNGSEFWNRSITGDGLGGAGIGAYAYCGFDDGRKNDVIVISESYNSSADESTIGIYAVRGSDEHQFWTRSVTGDGEDGAGIWTYPYCDLDNDTLDDVIIVYESYNSSADESTANICAIRGYGGQEFWTQSVTGDGCDGADISAYACYGFDDSNDDDVIVISDSYDSSANESTASLCVRQGYNEHQFWNRSVTGAGEAGARILIGSCHDLDNDAKNDVIVVSESYDSAANKSTASIYAMQGYSEQEFWNRSVIGDGSHGACMWVHAGCGFDDDSKDDVIVVSEKYNSTTRGHTANVCAKQGYDGQEFWTQSVVSDGEYGIYIGVHPYYDLNDDTLDDVIVISESYDSVANESTASMCVRQGGSGYQFWNRSVTGDGNHGSSMQAYPYRDLDNDAKNDVIVASKSYNSSADESTARVYAMQGYNEYQFWTRNVTGKDVWMEFYGGSMESLLEYPLIITGVLVNYTNVPTGVCVVDADSGTSLWCKQSAPSAPTITGDLNGDDVLTPADAVIALDIAISGDYNEYADVNEDGAVNSLDVLMILQAAANSITIMT